MIATTRSRTSASTSGWKVNAPTRSALPACRSCPSSRCSSASNSPCGGGSYPAAFKRSSIALAPRNSGDCPCGGTCNSGDCPWSCTASPRERRGGGAGEAGEVDGEVGGGAVAAGVGIEDAAASEGVGRGDGADDDAVVGAGDQGA